MDYIWRRTPSWLQASIGNTVDPAWGQIIPFTLKSGDQFRAPPPLPRQSPLYKRDYDERKPYLNCFPRLECCMPEALCSPDWVTGSLWACSTYAL